MTIEWSHIGAQLDSQAHATHQYRRETPCQVLLLQLPCDSQFYRMYVSIDICLKILGDERSRERYFGMFDR